MQLVQKPAKNNDNDGTTDGTLSFKRTSNCVGAGGKLWV